MGSKILLLSYLEVEIKTNKWKNINSNHKNTTVKYHHTMAAVDIISYYYSYSWVKFEVWRITSEVNEPYWPSSLEESTWNPDKSWSSSLSYIKVIPVELKLTLDCWRFVQEKQTLLKKVSRLLVWFLERSWSWQCWHQLKINVSAKSVRLNIIWTQNSQSTMASWSYFGKLIFDLICNCQHATKLW